MDKIRFNGKWLDAGTPIASADNRGLRYGDGVFETLRLEKGKLPLATWHFERLFHSLHTLGFEPGPFFTREKLEKEILELAGKNQHNDLARIRLMVFRGEGGLFDPGGQEVNYVIQSWPLNESFRELNANGLVIGLYPDARKSNDRFSNLKSANFLPYIMAARYAKQNKLNDCLLLNGFDRIADSVIANLFIYRAGKYITPPLGEGCVAGVMRRFLLEQLPDWGHPVEEVPITETEILQADHLFLSNAVSGIRWVGRFGDKEFGPGYAANIYSKWREFLG